MAVMALSWLVLIICFLTNVQAQRLEYVKEQIPIIEDSIQELPWTGIFPAKLLPLPCVSPPNQSSIDQIQNWYDDSTNELTYAEGVLGDLENTPPEVDWKVSLYHLIIAYIVNFRDAGDITGGLTISQKWIRPAAAIFGLEYIAFSDLALVPLPPLLHSGPFCGVFIKRGEKPFMILSFKGTTNALEGVTNLVAVPTKQNDGTLYNQAVHQGMYDGLFKIFPTTLQPVINYTWTQLEQVAKNNLGGSAEEPVPLYVSGHSLGAGYAQLAYAELFRKLEADNNPKAFKLKSLYAFGAPRVGAILGYGFAGKVKEVFEDKGKPIFRYSNEFDVVPYVPSIMTKKSEETGGDIVTSGWVHLDGGYILQRNASDAPYWTPDTSEIGELPKRDNDGRSSWEHHFPPQYYYSIKKIIDSDFDDPGAVWPPPELAYPGPGDNGICPN